ncbi:hypothetical protein AAFF_G00308260 [Aldrovandia affinis]|uniref:POPDC1-3 domain-containing protein n=1 Tax=Aldrovandia affinis TaxID=143900 RepID=A0AAD7SNZ7_9TELE|nr:hypothetical protein AAFF_G00308260 [Aldrovandia affinis]
MPAGDALELAHPQCQAWVNGTEGGFYHLGNALLSLGYMGGSGPFGALYIFSFLLLAFLCQALGGWASGCGTGTLAWGVLQVALCVLQLVHVLLRLWWEVVDACGNCVLSLDEEEAYALEGTTPIDRLSFLLSGRIRVSMEGQFLHYIFPFQFLDSPEWESLRSTEEGSFQVTLTAETDCRYVSWQRPKLQALLGQDRYLARLFSVMLGSDIADKLYSLNQRLYVKSGIRLDIRLPGMHHALASSEERDSEQDQDGVQDPDPTHQPDPMRSPLPDDSSNHDEGSSQPLGHTPSGTLPPHSQRGRAPLAPTDTPEL